MSGELQNNSPRVLRTIKEYREEHRMKRMAAFVKACMHGPEEQYWSSKHSLLASKGYHLRPRLQPGWEPPFATDEVRLEIQREPAAQVRTVSSMRGILFIAD